jgi:hypothetical protein
VSCPVTADTGKFAEGAAVTEPKFWKERGGKISIGACFMVYYKLFGSIQLKQVMKKLPCSELKEKGGYIL